MRFTITILFLTVVTNLTSRAPSSAITYKLTNGRFGENLLAFCCAQLLAAKYNITLLYKPFAYSDQLRLHTSFLLYETHKDQYISRQSVNDEALLQYARTSKNTLYAVCYFRSKLLDIFSAQEPDVFKTEHVPHLDVVKKMVQPRQPITLVAIPAGCFSIALHMRKGGGYDRPLRTDQKNNMPIAQELLHKYEDVTFPLKFPPNQFYIDQLRYVAEHYPSEKLYVHIFTDDKDPARLATMLGKALNNPNITFGYRAAGNAHDAHVLEDFFSMMQFDCLIRPDSSFSRAAELLGNHRMVIYPRAAEWQGNQLIITDVAVRKRN